MSKRTGRWLTGPPGRRRRRAAAVLAPLTTAALSVGLASEANAAQSNFRLGDSESFTWSTSSTGEDVTCGLSWELHRFDDHAGAEVDVEGGDLCHRFVWIDAALEYETPSGDLVWSRATTYEGSSANARVEPVGTVVQGQFSVRFEDCEPDYGLCEWRLSVAAPK